MAQRANEEVEQEIYKEMSNEEYRNELMKIFERIEDNKLLRYFYIFISERMKRVR